MPVAMDLSEHVSHPVMLLRVLHQLTPSLPAYKTALQVQRPASALSQDSHGKTCAHVALVQNSEWRCTAGLLASIGGDNCACLTADVHFRQYIGAWCAWRTRVHACCPLLTEWCEMQVLCASRRCHLDGSICHPVVCSPRKPGFQIHSVQRHNARPLDSHLSGKHI